jgi:glycosyltransferase involved in cell wall biosynthesis
MHTRETNMTWRSSLKFIKNRTSVMICVSESTKNDCIKLLNIPEKRLRVIPLSADEQYKPLKNKKQIHDELKQEYNIDFPFILFVGTLEKRKNVPTLLKSFYKLKKSKVEHKLVVVGGKGWKYTKIFDLIEELNLKNEVIFTDYVSDKYLVKLYNAADLFVYPSLYEGFGLPPLEAMACGCPVITSNTSSLPEVVGDAGIMINPNDIDGLTESMLKILTDNQLREEMSRKSLERAKIFSWKKTAKETWKVYEDVLND